MRAFTKTITDYWFKNGFLIAGLMLNVQPKQKKYVLEKLQIPEAFYNDIEDIERPRIELENGWTLIIMRIPVKSNDVKLPFILFR
jgi:hypothetical protein